MHRLEIIALAAKIWDNTKAADDPLWDALGSAKKEQLLADGQSVAAGNAPTNAFQEAFKDGMAINFIVDDRVDEDTVIFANLESHEPPIEPFEPPPTLLETVKKKLRVKK